MVIIRTFLVLAVFLAGFLTGTARAQLFLEDGKVVLAVSGGDRVNGSTVIHNTSSEAVDIRAYMEDFDYVPPYDGAKNFVPPGSGSASMSGWMSFTPQVFTLPPGGKQKIDYSINVPPVMDRGRYGVLFFEQGASDVESSGVSLVSRVGCLFFVEPRVKNKAASLTGLVFSGGDLTGHLVNQGNVVLIPTSTYYIIDESGTPVDRGGLADLYLAPQGDASWSLKMPTTLTAGKYTLMLNVDLGDGDLAAREVLFETSGTGTFSLISVKE